MNLENFTSYKEANINIENNFGVILTSFELLIDF